MSVEAVQAALRSWVKAGTGFDDGHVFWADQKYVIPAGPYATIRVNTGEGLGQPSDVVETYDPDAELGQEIEQTVVNTVELVVSVQFWGAPTVSKGASLSATELALKTLTALGLPSVGRAFSDADFSVHDTGTVQNLGQLLGADFEGRAAFDVRCYCTMTASERTGYIASIDVTTNLTTPTLHLEE